MTDNNTPNAAGQPAQQGYLPPQQPQGAPQGYPAQPGTPEAPQQGYPGQPTYQQGYPAAQIPQGYGAVQQPPMNVLAIVGFVLSLMGSNIIAIVLGAIALSQIKKTGERGRGLALAAVIIGSVVLVLGAILIIALLTFGLTYGAYSGS